MTEASAACGFGVLWVYDVGTGQSRMITKLRRPMVRGPRGLAVGPAGSVLFQQFDVYRREVVPGEL